MSAQPHMLKIEDFSRFPGGRVRKDGDFSGQEYRETILAPAIARFRSIIIDLRGAKILLPSFVDEALGPLVEQMGPVVFRSKVQLVYEPDSDVEDIIEETIRRRSVSKDHRA